MTAQPLWKQFRRLLLGTVAEAIIEEGLEASFKGMELAFDDKSLFEVPRFDNRMRFSGRARLPAPDPGPERLAALQRRLLLTWPELLSVLDIPIGDRLDSERNEVRVTYADGRLDIRFDLEAD